MNLTTEVVPYADGDLQLSGFAAWDDAVDGRRPGVLVLHGGAGLDDHAKDRTRRLARLGFVAFAADLYGDHVRERPELILPTIQSLVKEPQQLRRRAHAGLEWLAAHPQVDRRRAAVGYCFGGLTALELARGGADIAAAASIHGSLHTVLPAQPGSMRAKVLVCHGALDPHVPTMQVEAFADEMIHAGADWQLNIYGGAQHGFTHEATGPARPGVAYHAVADARSSTALQAFLTEAFDPAAHTHEF